VSSRRIDADHSGLSKVDSLGQADDVFFSYLSPLGPVVTHQIDDKGTWFHRFDTWTDFKNPANALGPKRGGEIEPNPVVPHTRHDVGGVDGEGNYLKDNIAWPSRSNVWHFNATRHLLRQAIALQLDLFHDNFSLGA
jgi:hypothetical protein